MNFVTYSTTKLRDINNNKIKNRGAPHNATNTSTSDDYYSRFAYSTQSDMGLIWENLLFIPKHR